MSHVETTSNGNFHPKPTHEKIKDWQGGPLKTVRFSILFSSLLLGLSAYAAEKKSTCSTLITEVQDICSEIEEDYSSSIANQFDQIRLSKEAATVPTAAKRLRKVRLSEAKAARDYARECKVELDSVPAECQSHDDYMTLAKDISDSQAKAVDFEVEAVKLQKIASSGSKDESQGQTLTQLLPSILNILSDPASSIMKAGASPLVPRMPANEK